MFQIRCEIVLGTTPPRNKTPGVVNDFFAAAVITGFKAHDAKDYVNISSTEEFFERSRKNFPEIRNIHNSSNLSDLFTNVTLPPFATEKRPHFTLANWPDFRQNTQPENGVDQERVDRARALESEKKTYTLNLSPDDFCLVVGIGENGKDISDKISLSGNRLTQTKTVGGGRDAVMTLKPDEEGQKILGAFSNAIFGRPFITNANEEPVPFHVTVAQTDAFLKTISPDLAPASSATLVGQQREKMHGTGGTTNSASAAAAHDSTQATVQSTNPPQRPKSPSSFGSKQN